MGKKIRVWDGSAWQDVAPSLPYTAIHSAQASMPLTGVDGQIWLDTDGTLAGQDFVPLAGGTMTGNLNTSSINSGGISGHNFIMNGAMDIWQRGTNITAGTYNYTADRWLADHVNTAYTSQINLVHTKVFDEGTAMNIATSGSGDPVGFITLEQRMETPYALSGKTVTLSFDIKNTGSLAGSCQVKYSVQSSISGSIRDLSSHGNIINELTTISSSAWQRVSLTYIMPTISENQHYRIGILFAGMNKASNFGNLLRIKNIKLEVGSKATDFKTQTENQQTELASCQRYYWRSPFENTYTVLGTGLAQSTAKARFFIPLPVPMRVQPSSIETGGTNPFIVYDMVNANFVTGSALTLQSGYLSSLKAAVVEVDTGGTSLTQYRPYFLTLGGSGNTNQYIAFSAEL